MSASYIILALRTPIGSFGGSLAPVRVDDLLGHLLKEAGERLPFALNEIDDVIVGCANQAGEDNRNLGRMSLLLAGWPAEVPATTINRLCGSSMDALIDAHARVVAGIADCVVAAGAESMTRAPYVLSKANTSFDRAQKMWDTALGWRFPNPRMEVLFPLLGMGETAEEVQAKTGITREAQDAFALSSHQKAITAWDQGLFAQEVVPVTIEGRKGHTIFSRDEGPRADSSLEKLGKLRPAFRSNGSVTAGNSSSLNDGAAVLVVCSEAFIKKHQLQPWARVLGGATQGLHPNIMGLGPIGATQKLCRQLALKPQNFDVVELNEAFAVQALACMQELGLDPARVNRQGGAIALGHPLGCSGARIVTTMLHQMKRDPSLKKGLATMCIGVGQGIAVALENCH